MRLTRMRMMTTARIDARAVIQVFEGLSLVMAIRG